MNLRGPRRLRLSAYESAPWAGLWPSVHCVRALAVEVFQCFRCVLNMLHWLPRVMSIAVALPMHLVLEFSAHPASVQYHTNLILGVAIDDHWRWGWLRATFNLVRGVRRQQVLMEDVMNAHGGWKLEAVIEVAAAL